MITHACELVGFASDAALAIDASGRVVAWNVAAEKLLGHRASTVIGCRCSDVLQARLPDGRQLCRSDCDVLQCFGECRPYGMSNCNLHHRDGHWVSVSIASIPMSERARRLYADEVVSVFIIRGASPARATSSQQKLQVFTLGGFRLSMDGRDLGVGEWRRKQSVTLLKYLVTRSDRPVYRAGLLDFLWPDVDERKARARLKVTVYNLRRELRESGLEDTILSTNGNVYQLDRSLVWVDSDAFEQFSSEADKLQDQMRWLEAIDCYEQARRLYRGDYLEEEGFANWCSTERERLRELYLQVLSRTAECHAQLGQYAEAVNLCRKALILDPCLESFHYMLMEFLTIGGHPDLALAQYHNCQNFLAREFETLPLPRTRRLYQRILNES